MDSAMGVTQNWKAKKRMERGMRLEVSVENNPCWSRSWLAKSLTVSSASPDRTWMMVAGCQWAIWMGGGLEGTLIVVPCRTFLIRAIAGDVRCDRLVVGL